MVVLLAKSVAAGSPDGGESAQINLDIPQCEVTDNVAATWSSAAGSSDGCESAQIN